MKKKTGEMVNVADFKVMVINPPKYYIGRRVFNEYEIRELIAQTAEGAIVPGIIFRDELGFKWKTLSDGRLCSINHNEICPTGWDWNGNTVLRIIKVQRNH